MVEYYKYFCDACGYEAMVSGKGGRESLDGGMTILCEDCKELYEIEPENAFTEKMKRSYRMLRCPEAYTHKILEWSYPGPCPKCGKPMIRGEMVIRWD
jgi:hypothetical protein